MQKYILFNVFYTKIYINIELKKAERAKHFFC